MTDIFDYDGYPTDEFLESIEKWEWQEGFNELLEWAMEGHIYPDYWNREKKDGVTVWNISTGGWSGNESIIEALQGNMMFWMMCWQSSKRGGHYQFRVQDKKEDKR